MPKCIYSIAKLQRRLNPATIASVYFCAATLVNATGTNWQTASSLAIPVDGMFHAGTTMYAYSLSPSLTLFSSGNGIDWFETSYSISPLGIGHDANGTLYAVTGTQTGILHAAHLWRRNSEDTWEYMVQLVAYANIIPVHAVLAGSEDKLLVKLYTAFGEGWWSGLPPTPMFVIDLELPFQPIASTNGNSIQDIKATTGGFAGAYRGLAFSSDGFKWRTTPSLMSQFGRLLHVWEDLHFLYDTFSQVIVLNHGANPTRINTPINFHYLINPPLFLQYNGRHLIVVNHETLYASTDYGVSWEQLSVQSPAGLLYHGQTFFLADRTSTSTVIYAMAALPEPEVDDVISGHAEMVAVELFAGLPDSLVSAVELDADHTSDDYIMLEYSLDLAQWRRHSIPTTNTTVVIPISDSDPSIRYYRWRALNTTP